MYDDEIWKFPKSGLIVKLSDLEEFRMDCYHAQATLSIPVDLSNYRIVVGKRWESPTGNVCFQLFPRHREDGRFTYLLVDPHNLTYEEVYSVPSQFHPIS